MKLSNPVHTTPPSKGEPTALQKDLGDESTILSLIVEGEKMTIYFVHGINMFSEPFKRLRSKLRRELSPRWKLYFDNENLSYEVFRNLNPTGYEIPDDLEDNILPPYLDWIDVQNLLKKEGIEIETDMIGSRRDVLKHRIHHGEGGSKEELQWLEEQISLFGEGAVCIGDQIIGENPTRFEYGGSTYTVHMRAEAYLK